SPLRTRTPSTCWCSAANRRSTRSSPRLPPATSSAPAGIRARRRDSGGSRSGCGTGCSSSRSSHSVWWRRMSVDAERFEGLEFRIADPLPSGISVLEASAGTGKTYTIAALAARYVAEGTPLERLLIVTFTRMATGELRERVRERLLCVRAGLDHTIAGAEPPQEDPVVELYRSEPIELQQVRRDRLARAIAEFDAATITTTHGFCQEVLVGLGIAAD